MKKHQASHQMNETDCGVHVLWHLKRLLELDAVDGKAGDSNGHLLANGSLMGKRLRLAEEMLRDVGLSVEPLLESKGSKE
jgi:hypothetical protein